MCTGIRVLVLYLFPTRRSLTSSNTALCRLRVRYLSPLYTDVIRPSDSVKTNCDNDSLHSLSKKPPWPQREVTLVQIRLLYGNLDDSLKSIDNLRRVIDLSPMRPYQSGHYLVHINFLVCQNEIAHQSIYSLTKHY